MEAIKISLSGLDVEWQRLEVIAQNLANINSTRNEVGDVFRPMRLLTGPDISFDQLMKTNQKAGAPTGTQVIGLEAIEGGVRRSFEPSHPHADGEGFVSYPEIDHAAEMTLMIRTSRAYEANLTALSIAQKMYSSALQLGRQ